MIPVTVNVKFQGGLFSKDVVGIVRKEIDQEILTAVAARAKRGGKGLGAQRNVITDTRQSFTDLAIVSTRIYPRTVGTSWQQKNIAIIKSMAPRVGNAAAKRIQEELGNG